MINENIDLDKIIDKLFKKLNVSDVIENPFETLVTMTTRNTFTDCYIDTVDDDRKQLAMLSDFVKAINAEREQAFKIGFMSLYHLSMNNE